MDLGARKKIKTLQTLFAKKRFTSPIVDIIPTDAYASTMTKIDIPTYVEGNDELTHPSVYFNEKGWNGYKYWMAYTPYPNTDNQYENPSIAASHDGKTWVTPVGLVNPIEPTPPGGAYNSDPVLFADPDGETLHCVFRQLDMAGYEVLFVRSSKDGTTWGGKTEVLRTGIGAQRNVSPAIQWTGNGFTMYTVDILASPKVIKKWTAPQMPGTFTLAETLSATCPVSGKEFWHLDFTLFNGTFAFLLLLCDTGSSGGNGSLHLATSQDGSNLTISTKPLVPYSSYKACCIPKVFPTGIGLSIWCSVRNTMWGWALCYTDAKFDGEQALNTQKIMGKLKAPPYVLLDTFDRANSTTGLGTSDSGDAWTALSGTFGISNKMAYAIASSNTKATIDCGVADIDVSVEIPVRGSQSWMMFRCVDTSNYLRAGFIGNSLYLQRVLSGSTTDLITDHPATTTGYGPIRVVCQGTTIKLYIGSAQAAEVTCSDFATATKVGLQTTDTNTRYDNLIVKAL